MATHSTGRWRWCSSTLQFHHVHVKTLMRLLLLSLQLILLLHHFLLHVLLFVFEGQLHGLLVQGCLLLMILLVKLEELLVVLLHECHLLRPHLLVYLHV